MIWDLAAAVAFLTRLPVARRHAFGAKEVGRAARWFPLVGALLGAIYVAALFPLASAFPPALAAILLVGLDAALTGAMHFDGLADTADGFGAGRTREDVLRIMRDHAIGSYGAVALIVAIGVKAAALAALIDAERAGFALILAPVLGRWSAVLLSATGKYARPDDDAGQTAGAPTRHVGRMELVIASATAVIVAVFLERWRGLAACALAAVVTEFWGWRCRRRIGGVTGDTLGTAIELSECAVLLLLTCLR